ncbi:MAG: carboxypeptidase-like regulatory domain-containing protein, partial [Prolixibacteraceae bacterium]|nr:carboxypeptidase-like regulatory domain-containing protein [Prolixibacteraceae bacterium]
MTRIIFSILAFLFLIPTVVLSQNSISVVSGRVIDQNTGEALIGATVYDETGMAGTSTNAQGYYSLKYAAADSARITVSFIGYESWSFIPDTLKAIKNVYLSPVTRQLNEVVITAGNAGNVQKAQTSAFMVNKTELLTLPSLASEPDLNLYFQLTPGVSFAGDGNSNLYVGGGGHDQNLFFLDDMPLFHVSHFGGFFSSFNADIINSATLYKGG